MDLPVDVIPRKTAAARELLAGARASQGLSPGLRMLLITVDGRRSLAELWAVANSLGLQPRHAFETLQGQGLLSWPGQAARAEADAAALAAAAASAAQARAQRLLRAKVYALDLAARMLAGREQSLRERARTVDSESRFAVWLDECALAISEAADDQRAALFRERVAAVALKP